MDLWVLFYDQISYYFRSYFCIESFDDMALKETLLRGIYAYGFEKPSAIQQRGIKPVVEGRDTIAQAQSGTGKTATFVISALQIIDENLRECQVLVLAPTRELAQQIHKVAILQQKILLITWRFLKRCRKIDFVFFCWLGSHEVGGLRAYFTFVLRMRRR